MNAIGRMAPETGIFTENVGRQAPERLEPHAPINGYDGYICPMDDPQARERGGSAWQRWCRRTVSPILSALRHIAAVGESPIRIGWCMYPPFSIWMGIFI